MDSKILYEKDGMKFTKLSDKKYRNDPRFRQRILDYKMNDYFKIRNNPNRIFKFCCKNEWYSKC